MTPEQLKTLEGMTRDEIARKYARAMLKKELTPKQFDFLLSLGKDEITGAEQIAASFGGVVAEEAPKAPIKPKESVTGASQKQRLLNLLKDGLPHSTVEIQEKVYGADHLGVARVASRVDELRKEGHKIICIQSAHSKTIYEYQLCP